MEVVSQHMFTRGRDPGDTERMFREGLFDYFYEVNIYDTDKIKAIISNILYQRYADSEKEFKNMKDGIERQRQIEQK